MNRTTPNVLQLLFTPATPSISLECERGVYRIMEMDRLTPVLKTLILHLIATPELTTKLVLLCLCGCVSL